MDSKLWLHGLWHSFKNKGINEEYNKEFSKDSYRQMKHVTVILFVGYILSLVFILIFEWKLGGFEHSQEMLLFFPFRVFCLLLNHITTCVNKLRNVQGVVLILGIYIAGAEESIIQNTQFYTFA
jgi:hypothetical protein